MPIVSSHTKLLILTFRDDEVHEGLLLDGIDIVYCLATLFLIDGIQEYLEVSDTYENLLKKLRRRLAELPPGEKAWNAHSNVTFLLRQQKCYNRGKFVLANKKRAQPSAEMLGLIVCKMSSVAKFLGNKALGSEINGLMYNLDGEREQPLTCSLPVVVNRDNWSTDESNLRKQIAMSRLALPFAHYPSGQK